MAITFKTEQALMEDGMLRAFVTTQVTAFNTEYTEAQRSQRNQNPSNSHCGLCGLCVLCVSVISVLKAVWFNIRHSPA